MNVVKFSRGRTLNLGNYESERIEIGVEFDVPEGGEPDDILSDAYAFVTTAVQELEDEIVKAKKLRR